MTSSDPSVQLDHTPGHIKHDGHNLTGFVIFLCSESIIFLAFFAGFSLFKLTSPEWLPAGVDGLEVKMPLINTIVLVSSSFVAYFAERYLHQRQSLGFPNCLVHHHVDGRLFRLWPIRRMVEPQIWFG
tara:strand:+ start:682 stop:1065 length:384 start_codon:yes stop_codon:yes gene_type:complete